MEEWITVKEAAKIRKCTDANIRYLINSGKIEARKEKGKWLIKKEAVKSEEHFLQSSKEKAEEEPVKEPTIGESEAAGVDRIPVDNAQKPSSQVKQERPSIEPTTTYKYSILLVDDEMNVLDVLSEQFGGDYNVFTATNGQDALSIMEQEEMALVMADDRMPGMTGTELLEKVWERYPATIRMIVSGYIDNHLLMKAINEIHAHAVIMKPWSAEELQFIIKRWLEHYDQSKELEEKARRIERLESQLEEITKGVARANERYDAILKQMIRQREEIQQLKQPFWQRWFRRR